MRMMTTWTSKEGWQSPAATSRGTSQAGNAPAARALGEPEAHVGHISLFSRLESSLPI